MDLEDAKRQARQLFDGIGPPGNCNLVVVGKREGAGLGFFEQISAITPPGFPLPGLLLFAFTQLLGLDTYGPEEKMAWGVSFSLRGSTFAFEHRKLGLRILCEPTNLDAPILKEVLGKARALTNTAEAYLASGFVADQLASGSFTMENLYHQLDTRYRFLRAQAEFAYATPPPPPKVNKTEFGMTTEYDDLRPQREGGALASAAVDAFFSRLEHLFVLATAFNPMGLPKEGMLQFLASNWRTKARAALNLNDAVAKRFYDKFVEIREEWRNPIAHGGFLSGGGSLHFHLPGVGALPAQLRRTPEGVRFGFLLHSSNFTEITKLFDEFDVFARDIAFRYPLKWAESGLDVAFDAKSLHQYREAMQSDEQFEQLIEYTGYLWDRHVRAPDQVEHRFRPKVSTRSGAR